MEVTVAGARTGVEVGVGVRSGAGVGAGTVSK